MAKENLDLKVQIEKFVLENKNPAEQVVRNENILEVSKTQDKSGINISTRNNVQTRVASIQTSPFSRLSLKEGRMYKSQVLVTTTLISRSKVLSSSYRKSELLNTNNTCNTNHKSVTLLTKSINHHIRQSSFATRRTYTLKYYYVSPAESTAATATSVITPNFPESFNQEGKITTATISIKTAAIMPRRT